MSESDVDGVEATEGTERIDALVVELTDEARRRDLDEADVAAILRAHADRVEEGFALADTEGLAEHELPPPPRLIQ